MFRLSVLLIFVCALCGAGFYFLETSLKTWLKTQERDVEVMMEASYITTWVNVTRDIKADEKLKNSDLEKRPMVFVSSNPMQIFDPDIAFGKRVNRNLMKGEGLHFSDLIPKPKTRDCAIAFKDIAAGARIDLQDVCSARTVLSPVPEGTVFYSLSDVVVGKRAKSNICRGTIITDKLIE